MKRSSQALGLLGWFAVTFAAAALGAWASRSAASFYASLALPAWAPPASVFEVRQGIITNKARFALSH